ncbi:hypothetical protein Tco_0176706, partial [Tanacetum coccineum]
MRYSRLRSSHCLLLTHLLIKSPGYIPESDPEEDLEEDDEEDPEEDPSDYPADRGDDDDDAEDEHLAPAEPTAMMSIQTQAPTPFLSEEVAERVLALPTPLPSPLSPYSSPLPQIPFPPLPIPPPSPISPTSAEASLGGLTAVLEAAPGRQMSRELGYGIRDTCDDLVGAIQEISPTTLEGVNQRVIELSSTVDQEDEIIYSHLDD